MVPNLKYYAAEKKMFGSDLKGVVLEKEISREIRRACRHFRVPMIRHELWEDDHSFYEPYGRFIRFVCSQEGERGSKYILVSHFLHELAHYIDDCQRKKEIQRLYLAGSNIADCAMQKILRAKWHGPRHRALMVLLVKWWLN